MKKVLVVVFLLVFSFYATGCYSQTFVVGKGAQSSQSESARQWFILWGLVPLNDVSSKMMAGSANDYTIKTEHSFVDMVISAFTGIVTVSCKTVEVKK